MRTKCFAVCGLTFASLWVACAGWSAERGFDFAPGPYLMLDERLLAGQWNVKRVIQSPPRLAQPIVTGAEDKNFQPWVTVLRDEATGRFRMWYNTPETIIQSHIGYIESEDGIHWIRPHHVLADPAKIQYGCCVLDEGPGYANPAQRYKLDFWGKVGEVGGMRLAVSPDGFQWTMMQSQVHLPHNHDLSSLAWDPLRKRYIGILSMTAKDGFIHDSRRITFGSTSEDLIHWRAPWMILKPDVHEDWNTQFYGLNGIHTRGRLLVAFVKILREDLNPEPGPTPADLGDPGRTAAGIGWTVLAWSWDGEHWERDTEPFLDRNPQPGAWDRAMTWADCQVPVGDETFIYYAGYQRGHKVARYTERQIGLVRMMRDRYVSRHAQGDAEGKVLTVSAPLVAGAMTANARVDGGLRVAVLDPAGKPYHGFSLMDCAPITGDSIHHRVRWSKPLSQLVGKPVQFEFSLRNGDLFSFDLGASAGK